MSTNTQDLVAFRLTGKRPAQDSDDASAVVANSADSSGLCPVLFAGYSDLTSLRYDFPVILINGPHHSAPMRSLTSIMNDIIDSLAPKGSEGEFDRKQLLELERQIRSYAASGDKGTLSKFWKKAQADLIRGTTSSERKALKACLDQARTLVDVDGEVIDCNEHTCSKITEHLWDFEVTAKAIRFRKRVGALILRLERILEADFQISGDAQDPANLKGAVGDALASSFDFKALSDLLKGSDTHDVLPVTRKERIENSLKALKQQRFFATSYLDTDERAADEAGLKVHKYIFNTCTKAHDAFLDRLPEMVELIKAIAIAELEIVNGYKDGFDDDFFLGFDQTSLMPEDLELFPSYLAVCCGQPWSTTEKGRIIETLSSGLPIKIMVQTDDILPPSSFGAGPFSWGLSGAQLAGLAVGLGSAFVLQSTASNLYQLRSELQAGLAAPGSALFSLFSGAGAQTSEKQLAGTNRNGSYITAAAAMEARAFPTFVFNHEAGSDLAARFSLLNNPHSRSDWTSYSLDCEDDDLQRTTLDFAFTIADFMATDERYRNHFVKVVKSDWVSDMVSVGEYLATSSGDMSDKIPYVLMINEAGEASRYVVDDTVIRATKRARDIWHDLQELGGINNSHARKRLEEEYEVWEAKKQDELESLRVEMAAAAPVSVQDVNAPSAMSETLAPAVRQATDADAGTAMPSPQGAELKETAPEPQVQNDDPWIETVRCTTCNECTDLNNQIFAYDDNMQAYVANPDGGPFRDIVVAAENCQVAIIHPGKPRNSNEPGLPDLIKRAELFM